MTALTLVQENGATLAKGTGYDAAGTLDVLLYAREGILVRKAGTSNVDLATAFATRIERAWAQGLQNLVVTYTAGYVDPATECPDLVRACVQLAILMYKGGRRVGNAAQSRQAGNVSYITDLPDSAKQAIYRYAPWGRPRCRLAA